MVRIALAFLERVSLVLLRRAISGAAKHTNAAMVKPNAYQLIRDPTIIAWFIPYLDYFVLKLPGDVFN